jgi:glycosyltransferase involved in cell wall biosynthesis
MSINESPSPLLLDSSHGFGSYSSYSHLSRYISPCRVISAPRQESHPIAARILNRAVQAFSTSRWYRTSSLQLEWQLFTSLSKRPASVVHFLWGDRDLGYFPILKPYYATPLCCTFHACPEDLPNILPFRERLKSLDAIIIMSKTQQAFFETCGVSSQKIHCIPHGIDTDFFTPGTLSKHTDDFIVLAVGNYRRNFSLLRKVVVGLEQHPEIRFKVIGANVDPSYFSDSKNVELLNNVTDLELLEMYQSASCLLLTVEDATANNALLEGMACGLPIVAEKVGGIPQYVNEECAILTDQSRAEPLIEAIMSLSKNSVDQKEMAQASRARALELSWTKIAAQTEALYSSLV